MNLTFLGGERAFAATPRTETGPARARQELLASLCRSRAGCRFGPCGVASSIPAAGPKNDENQPSVKPDLEGVTTKKTHAKTQKSRRKG